MTSTQYIQWINENEGRAYPITELATQIDDSGQQLPTDIVADLNLMLPPEHADVRFTSIRISPQSIVVGLASSASGLFIGTYSRDSIKPYTAYPLTAMLSDCTGWITFGNHIANQIEDYRFASADASGIETRALRIVDAIPVKRFIKFGGSLASAADKVVTFRGNGGVIFELDDEDPTGKTIRVSVAASHRDNFTSPCTSWAKTDICGAPPLRSINGVCPDENGRILLRFE